MGAFSCSGVLTMADCVCVECPIMAAALVKSSETSLVYLYWVRERDAYSLHTYITLQLHQGRV